MDEDVVARRKERCAALGGMLLESYLIIHDTYEDRKILTTQAEMLCAWYVVSTIGVAQSIAEIARKTRLSRPTVADAVDRLAAQGLVRRNGEGITVISEYYLNEKLDELQRQLTETVLRAADRLR